jgi:primosomal protein N' (replication factor Y)
LRRRTGNDAALSVLSGENLHPLGEGTERVEGALMKFFPKARIVRVIATARAAKAARGKLRRVHAGEADILVGTKCFRRAMTFPTSRWSILNADQGLYGTDFRSSERLFQLIMQVSGRAGRADKPGEVLIQTGIRITLVQRVAAARLPRFRRVCAHRAPGNRLPALSHPRCLRRTPAPGAALKFPRRHALAVRLMSEKSLQIMAPVPAPMERRAGATAQLRQSSKRAPLHFLSQWVSNWPSRNSAKGALVARCRPDGYVLAMSHREHGEKCTWI